MKYKIYKIVDNTNGNVYIGLTKQKLIERIYNHKSDYKNSDRRSGQCSSKIILQNNDWYSEIIEETDDKTREAFHIQNTPNCINERKFSYCYDHKESNRKHYLKNKTKLNEQMIQYHLKNRTRLNENKKERYFMNKFGDVIYQYLLDMDLL